MSDKSFLDNVKIVLRSLVVSSPKDITIDQLNRDYLRSEGQNIPYSKLGYHSLKDFLISIPDTLTYNVHTGVVKPIITKKNAHVHKFVTEQKVSHNRKKNNRGNSNHSNNQQPLLPSPQIPIWNNPSLMYGHGTPFPNFNQPNYLNKMPPALMDLNLQYHQKFEPGNLLAPPNIPTNIAMMNILYNQSMNYPSQSTYSNHVNTSIPIAESTNKARTRIPNGSTTPSVCNANVSSANQKHEEIKLTRKSSKESNPSITDRKNGDDELNGHADTTPVETVKEITALPPMEDDDPINLIGSSYFSSKYSKRIVAAAGLQDLKAGDIYQIEIKEITSTWSFFFQFYDMQDKVEDMHKTLSHCYEKNVDDMIIDVSHIDVGNACAAFYCDKWLRAEIIAEPDENDRVKLCLIDFGTIANVAIGNIRWLLSEFSHTPPLCYRGALAFLEPINNYKIERTVTKTFCTMVRDKSMMAVIKNIDENNTIFMTVIDTSQPEEDTIINEVLQKLNSFGNSSMCRRLQGLI